MGNWIAKWLLGDGAVALILRQGWRHLCVFIEEFFGLQSLYNRAWIELGESSCASLTG